MSRVDQWHVRMLNDRRRNVTFRAAIGKAVDECRSEGGDATVLDVGSGTALLSLFAVEAGADSVHAAEHDRCMASVAEEVLRRTAADRPDVPVDRIHVHACSSFDLSNARPTSAECDTCVGPSTRFDLIVAEILDAAAFGEGILSAVHDALVRLGRRKDGRPAAAVIPSRVRIYACLVQCEHIRRSHFCTPAGGGAELRSAAAMGKEPYTSGFVHSMPGELRQLTAPVLVDTVSLCDADELARRMVGMGTTHSVQVTRCGRPDAVVVWFEADLCNDGSLRLATGPFGNERSLAWEQAIFPVRLLAVEAGQMVNLSYKVADRWSRCTVTMEGATAVENADVVLCDEPVIRRLNDHRWLAYLRRSVKVCCERGADSAVLLLGRYATSPAILATIAAAARAQHYCGVLYAVEVTDSGVGTVLEVSAPYSLSTVKRLRDEQRLLERLRKSGKPPSFVLLDVCETDGQIEWCTLVQLLYFRLATGATGDNVTVVPDKCVVKAALLRTARLSDYALPDVSGARTCGFARPPQCLLAAIEAAGWGDRRWHVDTNMADLADARVCGDAFTLFELDLRERLHEDSVRMPSFVQGEGRVGVECGGDANAVILWYDWCMDGQTVYSTLDGVHSAVRCDAAFNQCAALVDGGDDTASLSYGYDATGARLTLRFDARA